MKKAFLFSIVCFLLILLAGQVAYGQSEKLEYKKHEIAFGVPILPVQEIATGISAIITDVLGQRVDDIKARGAFSLAYRYFPSRRWGVGVTGVYQRIDVNYKNPPAKSTFNTITVLANGQYSYIIKPRFDLYSRLGAGICSFNQSAGAGDSNDTVFAFQVTAIGIRAGGVFNSFIELGVGYEGIIHAGFSVRL
jgi:opacity protein-like surface antigen